MATTLDLTEMSVAEKLQLMERLWDNLSTNERNIVSPSWHADVLGERDRLIESGEEKFVDWESAKKQLRAELE